MNERRNRWVWLVLALFILTVTITPPAVSAGVGSTCAPDQQQPSGAIYRICMPPAGKWNGDLVVYAHGYVAFNEPIAIPEDQLAVGNISIPKIVNGLGYAFATTSYRTNGLAVQEGIADLVELVEIFRATHGDPHHIYLGGASEGGIITALAIERFPQIFDGGLAACGPVGDFGRQINTWGDFRVVFDYFFPNLIPGSPVNIPTAVIEQWSSVYEPRIQAAIRANPEATQQLLNVTRAPVDKNDPGTIQETILDLLWYNVFATNDGVRKLNGQPFDNSRRLYLGSDNDVLLNLRVQRFQAEPAALQTIAEHYQTTGNLAVPLVTLHTTGDPVVPYWHEPLYRLKIHSSNATSLHKNIPAFRYGHCRFNVSEVLVAFGLLVRQVTGAGLLGVEEVLPNEAARQEFQHLWHQYAEGFEVVSGPALEGAISSER